MLATAGCDSRARVPPAANQQGWIGRRFSGGGSAGPEALPSIESPGATSLLVEADHATCTFLAGNLSVDGFQVLEAANVLETLGIIETQLPDRAIVDLGLPDTDGLELLSEVHHSDRVAGTIDSELPLLVLTGRRGRARPAARFRARYDLVRIGGWASLIFGAVIVAFTIVRELRR